MYKSNYEERAKKFIQRIAPIVPLMLMKPTRDNIAQLISDFNYKYNRKVQYSRGYTRIALITSDYVIKIDYRPDSVFGDSESELRLYEAAEREGYDYLFAKITRFTYDNINFYIMPKINGINPRSTEEAWYYMTDDERDWCNNHNLIDLHSGNFGWKYHHIVIIDYAAYDDSQSTTSLSSF